MMDKIEEKKKTDGKNENFDKNLNLVNRSKWKF